MTSPDDAARPATPPARSARARLGEGRRSGSRSAGESAAEPRWAALWRLLAAARAELAEHERRADAVDTLFRTTIEPRERLLTLGVARVTEALVDHYDESPLERGERSVLGLWINENLGSLSGHPYAPVDPVAALVERWRGVLDAAADEPDDPFDPASPNYRTMPVRRDGAERAAFERDAISRYLSPRFERALRARPDGDAWSDPAGRRTPDGHEARGDVGAGAEAADDASGRRGSRDGSSADSQRGSREDAREGVTRGGDAGDGRAGDGGVDDGADPRGNDARARSAREGRGDATAARNVEDDARALVERLFRRLARALHPDREQDPERRDVKHVLMSTALAARRARDLDTLLSLHAEHVGGEPDAVDADAELLALALERQLAGMRRALHRARVGDPFRADLLARYEGADDAARRRRVVAHATRLDDEIRRLERLASALATRDGLEAALDDRREIERDRLTVDELTGA